MTPTMSDKFYRSSFKIMVLPFKKNERYIAEKEQYIVQTIYRSSLVSSFSPGTSQILKQNLYFYAIDLIMKREKVFN